MRSAASTIVSGHTVHIKDELPKIGARWDGEARVWRLPKERTHELVAVCDQKQIRYEEVTASEPKEAATEMLWPREEKKPVS